MPLKRTYAVRTARCTPNDGTRLPHRDKTRSEMRGAIAATHGAGRYYLLSGISDMCTLASLSDSLSRGRAGTHRCRNPGYRGRGRLLVGGRFLKLCNGLDRIDYNRSGRGHRAGS